MKLCSLLLITGLFSPALIAGETDVTGTYLTNAGFDNSCNYLFDASAENLASANGGANIQSVTGWTIGATGDNSAASSFEYGYAGTLNNPGNIPSQDPDGASGTGEGTLGVSVAWGGAVTYYQTVTLPAGTYKLQYKAYNSGPVTYDASQVGWVPEAGTSVLSTVTDFALETWSADVVNFTLTEETTGKIQVGLQAKSAGSGDHGRIFFDDLILLQSFDVDKTTLQALVDSATVMYNNQESVPVGSTVYTDLNTAITAAQVVLDNNDATLLDVTTQEGALKSAIDMVYGAIELQVRVDAWTVLPYDATSVIENPSFETGDLSGWINNDGFGAQTNTAFGLKDGTYYVEKWKSASTGGWSGVKLYQTIENIPNGIYNVTAAALNNPEATGGAFVYANDSTAEVLSVAEFTVKVVVENNTLELGYNIVSSGNYIAVDNFRLSFLGQGIKATLQALVDSAAMMYNSQELIPEGSTVYTDLNTAITAAQVILDNGAATLVDVEAQEDAIKAAIELVHGAIKLHTRIDTWTTLPYDATSVLENPSFETGTFSGWANVGLGIQSNTSFGKTGTYYAEKWQSSGSLTGIKVSQVIGNIPNGVYEVIAAAFTNTDAGGAYIYGNEDSVEVFGESKYSVDVEVTDNTLELGFAINASSNWVAVDHFELIYHNSNDTTLSTLIVSKGELSPAFDAAVSEYSVIVSDTVTTVTVTATPNDSRSTVEGDGEISLTNGEGSTDIIVSALNGDTKTYTLDFVTQKSSDATLASITLDVDGDLSPAFDAETTEYSVVVPVGITTVNISATAVHSVATVSVDPVDVSSGSGTATIVVKAEDGTEKTYTVSITIAEPYDNAALRLPGIDGNNSNIDISGLALSTLPYTIEMWFKPEAIPQPDYTSLLMNNVGNNGISYVGWQTDYDALRLNATGGEQYAQPTVTHEVTDGWHHVAAIVTDSSRTLILDGQVYSEDADFSAIDWAQGVTKIGTWEGEHSRAFNGLIDEVKIWNIAKSNKEVASCKFTTLSGDEAGLVAYYNFDDQKDIKSAEDLTGSLNGIITGGVYVESNYMALKPVKKEIVFVTPSVDSKDTICIQAIAGYMDSTVYNVTVLAKGVIEIADTTQLNAADVVIMGRAIGSNDVGTGAAVWDSITSPVLSMNMYGLRGLAKKAWWTPNDASANVVSDADTVLQADILMPNDPVFNGTNAMTMDWWSGMFSVFGVDEAMTSAGNGMLLAKTSDNRPLFIRWAANVEFYPEAGHAPNGDRTFIGCGNDNTELNYFGFSEDAEAIYFAELARLASGEATVISYVDNYDARLSNLTVDNGTLTPAFDAATMSYTLEVPVATATVNVTATAANDSATVVISENGAIDVSSGSATATITVTAENGTELAYSIAITVKPSSVGGADVVATKVYPTVSATDFNVETAFGNAIEVYDLTGALVKVIIASSDVTTITLDASGIYIIKVGSSVTKVVKN